MNDRPRENIPGSVSVLLAGQTSVHADNLDAISGLALIDEVVIDDDVHGPEADNFNDEGEWRKRQQRRSNTVSTLDPLSHSCGPVTICQTTTTTTTTETTMTKTTTTTKPGQLSGRCFLRHLLDGEGLVVHVDGESVLGDERVVVLVLGRIGRRRRKRLQRRQVRVFALDVLFRRGTVVDGLDDLGVDERGLGDDALDADHVADEPGGKTTRRHVLPAEGTLEADVKGFVLGVNGVGGGHHLLQRPLALDQIRLAAVQ